MSTLPRLPLEDSAAILLERFRSMWATDRTHATGDGKTVRRIIVRLLSPRFFLIGLWQFVDAICNFSMPFIIAALVRDLRIGTFENLAWDYALVFLLCLAVMGGAISIQQVLWGGARVGMRAKIAVSAALYTQTLHLDNRALLSTSAGAATNLVAIDATRLELSFTFFHMVWYAPLCVVILGVLLSLQVGPLAALPGLAFLVIIFAVQRVVGSQLARLRTQITRQTDLRVKLMHDVLHGLETLKVNAWEGALAARVDKLRAAEARLIWRSLALLATLEAFIFFAPGVATFIILVTRYALDEADGGGSGGGGGSGVVIEQAYAVLGLCNVLVKQFNVFPRAAKSFTEALVSFQRVERFLLLGSVGTSPVEHHEEAPTAGAAAAPPLSASAVDIDEEEQQQQQRQQQQQQPAHRAAVQAGGDDGGGAEVVWLDKVCATWMTEPAAAPHTAASDADGKGDGDAPGSFGLDGLSLRLGRGELCALVGEVGCGKSSVLQLLLGEMGVSSGTIRVHRGGRAGVGYVPQVTWVLNASVRQNITMGRGFDEAWYSEVVRSCALEPDFAAFADGDRTEIGERGVTVSGGQKARISLARALYGKPTLLLLDDPLSAVDMHVAQALVHEALIRLARRTLGSTVVLASHQLQFVPQLADQVLVLSHGRVIAQGPPAAVAEQGLLAGGGSGAPAASAPTAAADDAPPKDAPPPPKDAAATTAATTTAGAEAAAKTTGGASQEEMGRGNAPGEARRFYLRHLGWQGVLAILVTFVGLAVCRALTDWSLGVWINHGQRAEGAALYAALTASTVAFGVGYALSFTRVIGTASRIHAAVLQRVLRAPKAFFDVTPLGLIVNVFSKDMDTLDELLPVALSGFLKCLAIVTSAVVVAAVAAPAALVIMPLVLLVFRRLTRYFQRTANQLKRLDKASTGPLFSLYAETLHGVTSIRAFGLQRSFERLLLQRLEANHTAHFLWTGSNRWFACRLDLLTAAITLSVALCVVLFREHLPPSIAALALTYVVQTTSLFQWGFRMYAEVCNHFVSVERALTYTKLPQEPPGAAPGDGALEARGWPERGALRFADVRMAYRPGLPLVLDSLSFSLDAGAKTAIVGRSGAGKSSLSVALLRLAPLAGGAITLDGVDIGAVGLRTLRRAITFIRQDAVMFAGTLRENLDPFGQHTDAELSAVLEEVDWARLSGSADGVAQLIAEGGANLSSGTRQLAMLARALLRRSRLLLLDEATANVDYQTDGVIQRVLRSRFPHASILTIAHRIDTIIDYDRLLLMAGGRLAEEGRPTDLLADPSSRFSALVGTGPNADRLRAAAAAAAANKAPMAAQD